MRGNKLIQHYIIDIIYKAAQPPHLEKLKIIQNMDSLVFEIRSLFDKADHSFLYPFLLLGDTEFKKILSGILSGKQEYE